MATQQMRCQGSRGPFGQLSMAETCRHGGRPEALHDDDQVLRYFPIFNVFAFSAHLGCHLLSKPGRIFVMIVPA